MSSFSENEFRAKMQADAQNLPDIEESLINRLVANVETLQNKPEEKKPMGVYFLTVAALFFMAITSFYYIQEPTETPQMTKVSHEKELPESLEADLAWLVEQYNPDRLGGLLTSLIDNADRVVYKDDVDELKQKAGLFINQVIGSW